MKKLLPILFLTLTTTAFAQNNADKTVTTTTAAAGTVVVHKDARIDALIKKKAAINVDPEFAGHTPMMVHYHHAI